MEIVIKDQEEARMSVTNFELLLKIFTTEKQKNWQFKDKLYAKNVTVKADKVTQSNAPDAVVQVFKVRTIVSISVR